MAVSSFWRDKSEQKLQKFELSHDPLMGQIYAKASDTNLRQSTIVDFLTCRRADISKISIFKRSRDLSQMEFSTKVLEARLTHLRVKTETEV